MANIMDEDIDTKNPNTLTKFDLEAFHYILGKSLGYITLVKNCKKEKQIHQFYSEKTENSFRVFHHRYSRPFCGFKTHKKDYPTLTVDLAQKDPVTDMIMIVAKAVENIDDYIFKSGYSFYYDESLLEEK